MWVLVRTDRYIVMLSYYCCDYILVGVLSWTEKSLTLNEGKITYAHTLVEGVFFLKVAFLANILLLHYVQKICFGNFNIIYNSNNKKYNCL